MLIQVISSTTREGRFSERVPAGAPAQRPSRGDFDVEPIDLREYPLPFFDGVAPARAPREYASPELERLGRPRAGADGYIVLPAEYNHGSPAVLKTPMDWTFVEWRRKPMSFVG